jgi:cytochrome d ubiquinol oxidase subunit I
MVDFAALLTNPYGLIKFFHTIISSHLLAAFFVMGVSAWHLLRKSQPEFFRRSFRMAAPFALVAACLVMFSGDMQASVVARYQPTKFAALESTWETQRGAPMNLIVWPDAANERNAVQALPIPKMLSYLAHKNLNSEVKGLKEFPVDERPPVLPVFLSFRAMVGMGIFFVLAGIAAVIFSRRGLIDRQRWFLRLMFFAIPLPYLANQLGWIAAEVGRQPWIVYGLMKTSAGVSSNLAAGQVIGSLVGFTLLYGGLGVLDFYLLTKIAAKGPEKSGIEKQEA